MQIHYQDGTEDWVLLHLEVQSQRDDDFAQRMFTYYYRLLDAYNRTVTSVAILADPNPDWRVDHYEAKMATSTLRFDFTTKKLLDYDLSELQNSSNPFAIIAEAHLKAQETRKKPEQGYRNLLRIAKNLMMRGLSQEEVLELLHLVEWLFTLPNELELKYKQEIDEFQKENKMSYVSIFEREGIKQGIEQGLQQGIQQGLQQGLQQGEAALVLRQLNRKVGELDEEVATIISGLPTNQIEELGDALLDFEEREDLDNWLSSNVSSDDETGDEEVQKC